MKHSKSTFHSGVLIICVFLISFSSCKDEKLPPTAIQKEQAWAGEIYSAMKDIYLWNSALPQTFDATNYTDAQAALDYLMTQKIDPETKQPIDRYSFLDKIGSLSGEISTGTASGDYGFMVRAAYNSMDQVSFFVTYVYKGSPADRAGIERSFEITKINNSENTHPEVDSNGYLNPTSIGYTNMVQSLFNSSKSTFTFKKNNGTTIDVSLSTAQYPIKSILFDSIYTLDSKKLGYMVFNQFLGESSQNEITNTINRFESNGVQYLVVDLRYNGGGSMETCEKFCNLVAPPSANEKIMYYNKLNPILTEEFMRGDYNLTTFFNKSNSFNPLRIYFIVSSNTASASELLINSLRPYFVGNLFLIGETTYGKPCGFWATPIGYTEKQTTPKEGYDLYAVSLETLNANNEGGYYSGMTPGSTKYPGVKAKDTFKFSWGDSNDACLAQALNHISTNTFSVKAALKSNAKENKSFSSIDRQFKGMIDFRKQLPTRHK